jgi:hypothetical protein
MDYCRGCVGNLNPQPNEKNSHFPQYEGVTKNKSREIDISPKMANIDPRPEERF